ncbi:MAG: response regulator [Pseudomonadota bacterium]
MKETYTILIADRHRHVREFLRRELAPEGYHIILAKNGLEVIDYVYSMENLDLIILDLDQPDVNELNLLKKLNNRIPNIPVVIHSHFSDCAYPPSLLSAAELVEKDGQSVDRLKKVVSRLLKESRTLNPPAGRK